MKKAAMMAIGVLVAGISCVADFDPAFEVSAKCEGTRAQTWASLAWCEAGKCWLVAWREGYLNEPEAGSDVWCARISADGKSLDPAGIRLTGGKGLKDRPRVASDGKGFMVVWEDLRNGKDLDVYGANVGADGKVTTKAGGHAVIGEEHNQCRPDIIWAKGNYLVLWHGFNGAYSAFCGRVSPDGKGLDEKPQVVFAGGKNLDELGVTGAVLASDGTAVLAASRHVGRGLEGSISRVALDAATAGPMASLRYRWGASPLALSMTVGRDEAFMAGVINQHGNLVLLFRLDKKGNDIDEVPVTFVNSGAGYEKGGLAVNKSDNARPQLRPALAFTGKDYLLACEHLVKGDRFEIHGWRISCDGKTKDDPAKGFVIAADPAKHLMLPSVCVGPTGNCLVVYSEVRGVDDIKLMARIVK